jgi:Tfp pilus assembly protein PilF
MPAITSHRRRGATIEEAVMRKVITLTEGQKNWLSTIVVGLVLLSAIVLSGCDAPVGDRRAGEEQPTAWDPIAASVAASAGDTAAAVAPVTPRVVGFEEAEAAFRERRYADAVALFSAYLETKPDNPWGYYMQGLSALKTGDTKGAETAFGRALELDRTHVKSHLNLARVLLEQGRPLEALDRLDTALTFDSTSNVVHRLRGLALADLGHTEAAANEYRRAIVLDDTDVWAMNNLGLLYLRQGWYEEALPPLARAVDLDGTVAVFLNNFGMALEHTGRFAQAAEVYARATAADATHVKAAANLARIEGRDNDPFVEPADFGLLAAEFVRQVDGWRQWEVAVTPIPEP